MSLFNREHPILVRVNLLRALRYKANDATVSENERLHAQMVLDDNDKFDALHYEVMQTVRTDHTAQVALGGKPAGGQHPILQWIMKNWHMIYDLVRTILLAFGVPLPPLPNVPLVPSTPTPVEPASVEPTVPAVG